MTAETLKKAQNEIDEMIEKCARDASLTTPDIAPIYDGIADEEGYLNSKVRVAWVLKEPYDDKDDNGNPCGGEWSLPKDCFTLAEQPGNHLYCPPCARGRETCVCHIRLGRDNN